MRGIRGLELDGEGCGDTVYWQLESWIGEWLGVKVLLEDRMDRLEENGQLFLGHLTAYAPWNILAESSAPDASP